MQPAPAQSLLRCPWPTPNLLLLGMLSLGVMGCGGGDEAPTPDAGEQPVPKLSVGVVKPAPQTPQPMAAKKVAKRNTPRATPPRRKKPPGLPVKPEPENEFAIVGNADQFALADVPFETGESFAARLPAVPDSTSHFSAAPPKSDKANNLQTAISLPEGFAAVPGTPTGEGGWPSRIICLKDESEMVLIPAGLSTQGIEQGPEDAQPQHQVQLDAYYIDVHEVTFGQYRRYRRDLGVNKERMPPELDKEADASLPATGVRWGEAIQYARWAGKELPSEAEWERAARGSEALTYPWGHGKPIWHRPRELGQLDPIGSFRGDRSPYGVMDLAGNAREWCYDWYSPRAYKIALDQANTATLLNPTGPRTAVGSTDRTARVVRGSEEGWEVWRRTGMPMGDRSPTIGFRCVWRMDRTPSHPASRSTKDDEEKPAKKKQGGF